MDENFETIFVSSSRSDLLVDLRSGRTLSFWRIISKVDQQQGWPPRLHTRSTSLSKSAGASFLLARERIVAIHVRCQWRWHSAVKKCIAVRITGPAGRTACYKQGD